MVFRVTYKGIQQFVGRLGAATCYLEDRWGSVAEAYEFGVKMEPIPA